MKYTAAFDNLLVEQVAETCKSFERINMNYSQANNRLMSIAKSIEKKQVTSFSKVNSCDLWSRSHFKMVQRASGLSQINTMKRQEKFFMQKNIQERINDKFSDKFKILNPLLNQKIKQKLQVFKDANQFVKKTKILVVEKETVIVPKDKDWREQRYIEEGQKLVIK